MLSVKNISFNYRGQSHFPGLKNFSLELDRSEIVAIVGKSGSGKTTALKCIYGLEELSSGSIKLDGELVTGPSHNLVPGHEDMRLVSQDYYVLDNHTVFENIADRMPGWRNEEKLKRASRLMKLLDIYDLRDVRARLLSSGQKQRVAIARALAVIPKVLLLDEPFSNLDKILSERLLQFITQEVRKKKCGLILITHLAEEALRYADRIIVMDKGRTVESGSTEEVYHNPRKSRLAGLLGAYNLLNREDLADASQLSSKRARIFTRPDRIKTCAQADSELSMEVISSRFNGRCYELTGRTASGDTVVVFDDAPLDAGTTAWLRYTA